MFLSSRSLRSFSSQECSFPQESYLLFLFLSPTLPLFLYFSLSLSLTFQSLFPPPDLFSFQPSLRDSVRCTRSPLCHPLLPFSLTCSIFFTLLQDSFFLSPTVSRPRSLSYSPFIVEGRTKIMNPRGICREPQLDRGVSPGSALAPAVTFQPQRKCLTLALSVTKLGRPDFSSILNRWFGSSVES